MISSVQGYAGWLPANHAPQVNASEVPGERENDGDGDDAARAVKAPLSGNLPPYLGGRIDTLA